MKLLLVLIEIVISSQKHQQKLKLIGMWNLVTNSNLNVQQQMMMTTTSEDSAAMPHVDQKLTRCLRTSLYWLNRITFCEIFRTKFPFCPTFSLNREKRMLTTDRAVLKWKTIRTTWTVSLTSMPVTRRASQLPFSLTNSPLKSAATVAPVTKLKLNGARNQARPFVVAQESSCSTQLSLGSVV